MLKNEIMKAGLFSCKLRSTIIKEEKKPLTEHTTRKAGRDLWNNIFGTCFFWCLVTWACEKNNI